MGAPMTKDLAPLSKNPREPDLAVAEVHRSANAKASRVRPSLRGVSSAFRSAVEPSAAISPPASSTWRGTVQSPGRPNASIKIAASTAPPPMPPSSMANGKPNQPSCAKSRQSSRSTSSRNNAPIGVVAVVLAQKALGGIPQNDLFRIVLQVQDEAPDQSSCPVRRLRNDARVGFA